MGHVLKEEPLGGSANSAVAPVCKAAWRHVCVGGDGRHRPHLSVGLSETAQWSHSRGTEQETGQQGLHHSDKYYLTLMLKDAHVFLPQVVYNVGLCVCLYDVTKLEDSYIFPGDGASHTKGLMEPLIISECWSLVQKCFDSLNCIHLFLNCRI